MEEPTSGHGSVGSRGKVKTERGGGGVGDCGEKYAVVEE